MKSIKSTIKIIFVLALIYSTNCVAQDGIFDSNITNAPAARQADFNEILSQKFIPQLSVRRSGPYIGIQRGKYTIVEFGGEMQWNRVKLRKPITHAGHMGFNYNFKYNVLGYDAGYWFKVGRLDLTYGANLVFRSDFDHHAFGIAPVVGFKFWQLHLQTGYHFLSRPAKQFETNTLFISLRYVFINDRDWNWKKQNKKKK